MVKVKRLVVKVKRTTECAVACARLNILAFTYYL